MNYKERFGIYRSRDRFARIPGTLLAPAGLEGRLNHAFIDCQSDPMLTNSSEEQIL